MERSELERLLLRGLREFYLKQGLDIPDALDLALDNQAEFLSALLESEGMCGR